MRCVNYLDAKKEGGGKKMPNESGVPIVNDILKEALPHIAIIRAQHFEQEIARWLLGERGVGIDGKGYEYPCPKCRHFHLTWSVIGRRHLQLKESS